MRIETVSDSAPGKTALARSLQKGKQAYAILETDFFDHPGMRRVVCADRLRQESAAHRG